MKYRMIYVASYELELKMEMLYKDNFIVEHVVYIKSYEDPFIGEFNEFLLIARKPIESINENEAEIK